MFTKIKQNLKRNIILNSIFSKIVEKFYSESGVNITLKTLLDKSKINKNSIKVIYDIGCHKGEWTKDIKSLFPKREDYDDFITDVAVANAQHYTISNYMSYGKKKMITDTKEDLEQLTQEYKEYIKEVKKGLMKKKEIPVPVIDHMLEMVPPL